MVFIDGCLCSAASDYRKRRKSEPSSSQTNAQSHPSRAVTSPKPVEASRVSSSLKKPVVRSSPASPSRAKGTHKNPVSSAFVWYFTGYYSLVHSLFPYVPQYFIHGIVPKRFVLFVRSTISVSVLCYCFLMCVFKSPRTKLISSHYLSSFPF